MQVWNLLYAARWKHKDAKKSPKIAIWAPSHNCRAMSSQLRHVSTIRKKLVKHQYVLHMLSQYGELRPPSGWDRFTSLGHPCKFQRVSRLGSVTARNLVVGVSQTVALNRGRHLYLAGRPSRWALAHILVDFVITSCGRACRDGYNAVSHAHIYGRWCLPSTWTICLVTPTCLRGMCYAQVFLMSFSSWLQLFCI